MRKLLDVTNPFWTFVGRLVDAFLLHLCWLLCCIPVVTIGASTTALYAAMMKDVADEEAHYIRAFFKSFKQNLGQGIVLGLIYMVVGAILAYAIYLFRQMNEIGAGAIYQIGEVAAIAFSVLWLMTVVYAFALLARFYNTIPRIILNAFFLAFKNFGWTVLIVALIVAYAIVLFVLQFLPIVFVGYGLVALIHAYILNHMFKPLIAQSLGEQDPDAWTVPEEEEGQDKAGEETAEGNAEGKENAADVWPPVKNG
ncbi:MAG: DUF624 domain-containing protein [Lachnospiraceae bacterium]|nr:DUF624 domain-containing protein [Lachnospiraceae bacterium]